MMKKLFMISISALTLFTFSSCGDSREKVMKDQVAWMEEMTEVVNKVADGSLSSSEAAERIGELGKEGEKIFERKKALNEDLTPEEAAELIKTHADGSMKVAMNYMEAIERLSKSGRMTREVASAIESIKAN